MAMTNAHDDPLYGGRGGGGLADYSSVVINDCSSNSGDDDSSSSSASATGLFLFSEGFATVSRPILFLDFLWNLAFVFVALSILLTTFKERPSTPLRLWLSCYALQCAFHVSFISLHYRRADPYSLPPDDAPRHPHRLIKRLESANTIISSIWWVLGFYWVVMGGQSLLQDSPHLYWLTVVFLAFDVFFVMFCVGMVFLVFFALFCFIPLLALIYSAVLSPAVRASEDVIRNLPKHTYRRAGSEIVLRPDDSECCICLSSYSEGDELRTLPCNHHFHCGCICRWLQINATCPLCKYDILRRDSLV